MSIPTDVDPADFATSTAEQLFENLVEEHGLHAFDIIAGMHGEIVRRMILHLGFEETERLLGVTLATVIKLADEAIHDPAFALSNATPAGTA